MVDIVVVEIKKVNGYVILNYDFVVDGEKII